MCVCVFTSSSSSVLRRFLLPNSENEYATCIHFILTSCLLLFSFHSFSDHPILQILESRTSDKQAVEFVRKQKARLAS